MRQHIVDGGWYGDCLVGGDWAALIPNSHIETSRGRVELPGQNALYLRCAERGGALYLAGVGHDDKAWLWDGLRWREAAPAATGMKAVAFGPRGLYVCPDGFEVHVIDLTSLQRVDTLPIATGSGGIQYVRADGTIATGDATYAGPGIAEWSEAGDVKVGQGFDNDPPLIYRAGGTRHVLALVGEDGQFEPPKPSRWIKLHRVGDSLAVTVVQQAARRTLFFWLDVSEIDALPEIETPTAPVDPLEPIVAVNRELWFSCYDGGDGSFPRNFTFAAGFPVPFRYITGHPSDANADDIERACAAAGPGPLPRMPYVPHGTRLPRIELSEWIGVECYWKVWETGVEFERNRREVARAANRPVVFIPQCYSSNANNVGYTPIVIVDGKPKMTPVTDPLALRRVVPVIARLMCDTPNCVGALTFSGGFWRVSGYEDHPEVHGDYRQLASTIRTPVIIQPPPPPPPPPPPVDPEEPPPPPPIEPPPPVDPPVPPIEPPTPPIPEPPMNLPKITITLPQFPIAGDSPLRVKCVYAKEPDAGPIDFVEWQQKKAGGEWARAALNPGEDPDHTYTFTEVGEWFIRAVGINDAGRHETGKERKVIVRAAEQPPVPDPPQPPTPPTPPATGDVVTLKTVNGDNFLTVQNGVLASGPTPAKFSIEQHGDRVALKVGKFYARAVNGGGGVVAFDREEIGTPAHLSEELFRLHKKGDTYAFETTGKWFISAVDGGGGAVLANQKAVGGWEQFTPVAASSGGGGGGEVNRIPSGINRLNRRTFTDDSGDYLGLGATFFTVPWLYKFDRDRLIRNLEHLAERGVNYVRALGVVGPEGWTDRTIDPRWSDYEEVIAGSTDLVWDHGMRTQWTIFGGDSMIDRNGRERVVQQFIAMMQSRMEKIQLVEAANEGWQNGFEGESGGAELKRYAQMLRDAGIPLVATTAPQNASNPEEAEAFPALYYKGSDATLMTIHFDRDTGGGGGMWRPTRQVWEGQFMHHSPGPWTNNEPRGPKSSVTEDDDPLRITMDVAYTWLCGGAGYVLHTGPGVRAGGAEDLARGRESNFWEVPNLDAILTGIDAVRSILPADIQNWTRGSASLHTHFREAHPFENTSMLRAQDETRTMVRHFSATRDRTYFSAPIGLKGVTPHVARFDMDLTIYHPLSGEVLQQHVLSRGEVLDLGDDPPALILKVEKR